MNDETVSDNNTTAPPTTNSHTNPNKEPEPGGNGTLTEQTQVIKHHRKPKQKPKPHHFTTTRRPSKPLPEETDYFQGYVDLQEQSNEGSIEQGYSDQEYDGPQHEDISIESDSMDDAKFPDESEEGYKDSYIQNMPHIMDKNTSGIPPGILSHYIPGDTPTLYAGML